MHHPLACTRLVALTLLSLLAGQGALAVTVPDADAILTTLRPTHPRLLLTKEGLDGLRRRVQTNDRLKRWVNRLRRDAAKTLTAPPSQYVIPDGKRLLATSRRVLNRVSELALLANLDDKAEYVNRAWEELAAAAAFKDWNPSHFLDTAEMTAAFALAYDWLYDRWTPQQRRVLRTALLKHGLQPGLAAYREQERYGWWVFAHHNWNQVCNGGLILGALALGDELPTECREIVKQGLESLKRPLAEFAPDGAWPEGPGYWNYATRYTVFLLAALETALGTDFGFSRYPGFSETGFMPLYMTGPTGIAFNFADAHEGRIRAPQLFWLASRFHKGLYAWYQTRFARGDPWDVIWYPDPPLTARVTSFPRDRCFRKVEVATFRSKWEDRAALFVAFKAGSNRVNHGHLDLGSFVLDARGRRWFVDLGSDDYNLPGYFGRSRWTYYRLRAEGHNTLVLDPDKEADQDPRVATKIIRFVSEPDRAFAIADLTPAYRRHARQVQRGIAVLHRNAVLVQDEVTAAEPVNVWSFFHTRARVELDTEGVRALLSQGKAQLRAELLSPPHARFHVMDAAPLPSSPHPQGQAENHGVRKLAVHLPAVESVRLAILFTPVVSDAAPPAPLELEPLAEW